MIIAAILIGALTGATTCLLAVHGVLRVFMEERGVSPWSFRDTAGSTLLITGGAGLISAAASVSIVTLYRHGAVVQGVAGTLVIPALAIAGASAMRLGLIALRKLT